MVAENLSRVNRLYIGRHPLQTVTQSQASKAALTHHSPLEGESARRGRQPDGAPVGGASNAPATPHRPGEPQGPHRLPLKGGVMGRMRRRQESIFCGGANCLQPACKHLEMDSCLRGRVPCLAAGQIRPRLPQRLARQVRPGPVPTRQFPLPRRGLRGNRTRDAKLK